jgi:APA family basic amino acid/polyamine antiporter
VRLSATFQNWTTFGTLGLFIVFVGIGVTRGSTANFAPLFTHTPFISIFLVLQIVPYYMTGYESVTKAAEEANPEFRSQGFMRAIWSAIIVGFVFYIIVIAAVGFVAPWHELAGTPFLTAVAFEHAIGSRWIVSIILAAALLSLFKVFNGNFVAASRLLFAMGRRGLVDERLGAVHPLNRTPGNAVLWVGAVTGACMFLGSAILVPISDVGSLASAIGWFAACAAYLYLRPPPIEKIIASVGGLVALAMVLMKVLPYVPGNFSRWEWLALGLWVLTGILIGRPRGSHNLSGDKNFAATDSGKH